MLGADVSDMSRDTKLYTATVRPTITRGLILLVLSSIVIIFMLSPLEPIDYIYFALSSGLNVAPEVFLMVSDMLLLLAGYMLASSLNSFLSVGRLLSDFLAFTCSRLSSLNNALNKRGLASLTAAMLIIVFWNVPSVLDVVLLQYGLHWIMHGSIFFAGVLIYAGFKQLTSNMRFFSYFVGCKAMEIFGAYLLVSRVVVYASYPFPQQAEAGAAMVAMCMASDATSVPLWLRRIFK